MVGVGTGGSVGAGVGGLLARGGERGGGESGGRSEYGDEKESSHALRNPVDRD